MPTTACVDLYAYVDGMCMFNNVCHCIAMYVIVRYM